MGACVALRRGRRYSPGLRNDQCSAQRACGTQMGRTGEMRCMERVYRSAGGTLSSNVDDTTWLQSTAQILACSAKHSTCTQSVANENIVRGFDCGLCQAKRERRVISNVPHTWGVMRSLWQPLRQQRMRPRAAFHLNSQPDDWQSRLCACWRVLSSSRYLHVRVVCV